MADTKAAAPAKSNMTVAEKHGLIGNFLENFLSLGGMLVVHDDGTISYASRPNEPIMLKVAGDPEPRPLVVYRTQIDQPKAIVINPFVEPVGKDPTDKLWFYNTTNTIHATTLTRIIEFLFTKVIQAASGEPIDDPTLVHVLSGLVNSADSKTSKEFAKIVKALPEFDGGLDEDMLKEITLIADQGKPKDFVTISRSKVDRRTILTTFLYNQENDLKKKFGNKIRKKTWTLIEKLFKEIYATENIYDPIFDETTDQKRCPTFLTYAKVMIKSWNKFIPYLHYLYGDDGAEEQISKIIFLEDVLDKLDDLSMIAHWARGCINGQIQFKDGEKIEANESETLVDKEPQRRARRRPLNGDRDQYLEDVKDQIDRSTGAETTRGSALDILDEQSAERTRRELRERRNYWEQRDYDRRDSRYYDRRDDYDSRRGDRDRGGYGRRSALEVLGGRSYDDRYDAGDRRYQERYRMTGRRIGFGYR